MKREIRYSWDSDNSLESEFKGKLSELVNNTQSSALDSSVVRTLLSGNSFTFTQLKDTVDFIKQAVKYQEGYLTHFKENEVAQELIESRKQLVNTWAKFSIDFEKFVRYLEED